MLLRINVTGVSPAWATSSTPDSRTIAVMRLVLAASALISVLIGPSAFDQLSTLIYLSLGLYTAYSGILYVFALRESFAQVAFTRWAHWIDVAWYLLLIGFSQGTNSIFFFFFFFAILVASFSYGFIEGFRVALVSGILFALVGYITAPLDPEFELNRFLLRPIYLLVLGYMMAYWGGFEIAYKRRLALLKEVSTLTNPRFGVDQTLGTLLERLRTFYDADTCLIITAGPLSKDYFLRRAVRGQPQGSLRAEMVPAELGQLLSALPPGQSLVYHGRPRPWELWGKGNRQRPTPHVTLLSAVAVTLEAVSFVTVSFQDRREAGGRLYLTSSDASAFGDSDADLLYQVLEHVAPVLDNIRLVDRLASDAAEEERSRIARDLHDSVIQPYIGLQMGLVALRQTQAGGAGDADLSRDIERLIELTKDGVTDLRGYVQGLRVGGGREGSLLPAMRRFSSRFSDATGIETVIHAPDDMRVDGRLAAEVFQMVAEGLSNIRKHTAAQRATVALSNRNNRLTLRIENQSSNGASAPRRFTPRSITERALALGGSARVEQTGNGATAVIVEIPL